MSVIVTDAGFVPEDWNHGFSTTDNLPANAAALGVEMDGSEETGPVADHLPGIDMIRINFSGYADGRGFTLAARLRRMGYAGRLRAAGPLIADQYAMARRSGFDEVEISDETAARQPEDQWKFRADWTEFNHQARLRG